MPLIPTLADAAHHAHALTPYYLADRPASVMANPKILAWSIFGNMLGALLSFDSIWRMSNQLIEDPRPRWHPVTIWRVRILLSAVAVLMYIGPDAVVFTAWPDVTPPTRYMLSLVNRLLDGAAVFPFAAGWLLGLYSSSTIEHQLSREPIPIDLWLTWPDMKRAAWIGLLVFLASVMLSFGR